MADEKSQNNSGSDTITAEEEQTIRLREEQLNVQKTAKQAGSVNIRKEVVTENQTITVPVQKEKVIIERREVAPGEAEGDSGEIGSEEYNIPIMEEEVSVTKKPVVTEEVKIGKTQKQETQQVQDSIRKEKLRVDEEKV